MSRTARLLALLVTLVALAPLSAAAQQRDASGERRMLRAVNQLRAEVQLAPLERMDALDAAALVHSSDMAEHGELLHVSERTGTPADRMLQADVDAIRIAQNIARQPTTRRALDSILSSEAHRAQLLDPGFTHIGLAAVRGEGGVYVTQVLARIPQPEPEPEEEPEEPEDLLPPPAAMDLPRPTPAQPPAALQAPRPEIEDIRVPEAPTTPAQPPAPTIRVPAGHRRVAGYWLQQHGRWWYFPVPPRAVPGTVLYADPNVHGPPPGVADDSTTPPAPSAPPNNVQVQVNGRTQQPSWRSPRRNGTIYWY